MKVLYFGTYEKDYPRNRIFIKNLREQGIEVVECHSPLWERQTDKTGRYLSLISLIKIMFRLCLSYAILLGKFMRAGSFDYLIVGYIGQADVFLAKFLMFFKKKPLIFNPMISLYDTLSFDRKIFKAGSIMSKTLFLIDKWAFELSDIIILDTQEQIDYISELLKVEKEKFLRVFIGADETVFYPRENPYKQNDCFNVLFYGKFIPLHGIHHILNAAKQLENDPSIRFQIIGKGQLTEEIHHVSRKLQLKNMEFIEWVPYEELPDYITRADVCLGIFGDTEKAMRVVPNKVFQALACGKPVITLDTPAIRELGKIDNLILCSHSSGEVLAKQISAVKKRKAADNPPFNNRCVVDTGEWMTLLARQKRSYQT